MLARKYKEYAWEEELQQEQQQQEVIRKRKADSERRVVRHRIFCIVGIILVAYLASVVRSEAMVRHGDALVALRHQESQLITKNNELKIEVEQLKGPERIIGLAEQRLGMSVARSNIYLKGVDIKK